MSSRRRMTLSAIDSAAAAGTAHSVTTTDVDEADSSANILSNLECGAGAHHVSPSEKAMLLREAEENGQLMKDYGIIERKPRALGYVAAALAVFAGRFRCSAALRSFNCKAACFAFDISLTHRASALRRHVAGGVSGSPRAVGWRQGSTPGASFSSGGVDAAGALQASSPPAVPTHHRPRGAALERPLAV